MEKAPSANVVLLSTRYSNDLWYTWYSSNLEIQHLSADIDRWSLDRCTGRNCPDIVIVKVLVICFFFPFPTRGTFDATCVWYVRFPVQTCVKGAWSKLILRSSEISCQDCNFLILRWKSSFASLSNAEAIGIFAEVAIRLVNFRPSFSKRYNTWCDQSVLRSM